MDILLQNQMRDAIALWFEDGKVKIRTGEGADIEVDMSWVDAVDLWTYSKHKAPNRLGA